MSDNLKKNRTYRATDQEYKLMRRAWKRSKTKLKFTPWVITKIIESGKYETF